LRGQAFLYNYRESISITKGARIEARISQTQQELKLVKDSPENPMVDSMPTERETQGANTLK